MANSGTLGCPRHAYDLLTGASRGIGLATLTILLADPFSANVITLSRSTSSELQELLKAYPDQLKVCEGDVTRDADNEAVVKLALESFGSIDGLILNAGTIEIGRIAESEVESAKRVFDVNFFSIISILRYAIPHLRSSNGRVVFVSSGAAVGKVAGWASYNSSKAAVNSLARTLANEEPELTTISIRPGVVDTDMQTYLRKHGPKEMKPEELDRFISLHASKKLLPTTEPAKVIAGLSIKIPIDLSGEFLSWDSEQLAYLK
ncbi:hypothetical protein CROQUDRAFT_714209 [Cronartium quercuum f. sp. fusiforme G11]|uniref:Ketoreductase domain-containing protein n=1 Tax=Cronartium quercuum f. sp. fusiforme G11 TaxID=708437 RepID=A0A9P6NL53_9BASI|nr:hypothetical protein CROQUDRAFT_714209 [Cronartium quercuum f. sp. fusiforme G11]